MTPFFERLLGAVVLGAILWLMFAIPYVFVFMFPQPLLMAFFVAVAIATFIGVLDWLVDKRRS